MSLFALLLLPVLSATPPPPVVGVSKCRGTDGSLMYQEGPCPTGSTPIDEITLNREYSAPTGNGVRSVQPPGTVRADLGPGHKGNPNMQFVIGESSFACSAGKLRFYRHTYCPEKIHQDEINARGAIVKRSVAVSARIVPRAEACAAIGADDAMQRAGREFDQIDPPGEVSNAHCKLP